MSLMYVCLICDFLACFFLIKRNADLLVSRKQIVFGVLLICSFSFVSCSKIDAELAPSICADVTWSHQEGNNGPSEWKHLCNSFCACGGKYQSPIDIRTSSVKQCGKLASIEFNYSQPEVDIEHNDFTIQFNISEGNSVNIDGKKYDLLQFHYHALSEHTINGKHSPLELHFVHRYSDDDFAVLGLLIVEGAENELFSKYLNSFPKEKGEFKSNSKIDLLGMFPTEKTYYNYKGSLTTPPCTEVVNWYLLKNPITASKSQIDKFSAILQNNYRPVQAINGRVISEFNG